MVKTGKKMNLSGIIILGLGLCIVFLILYVVSLRSIQVTQVTHAPAQVPSEIQVVIAEDYTDALKNVYAPPVRYREIEYRQLGYLTAPGRDRLPLFGRMLNRRDKWTYYTLEQGIKLPIEYKNRLCTQSPGCDEFSSGDMVKVEATSYKVNLYETFIVSY